MRPFLLLIFIANCFNVNAQLTFEKIYPFTHAFEIIEMPDQSFIGCGDSSQNGLIFSVSRYGNLNGTFSPILRGANVLINDIALDPFTGGYAICGNAPDTTGNNNTGYYLLMNSAVQNSDSIFYNGGINGPYCSSLLRTSNNDFIVSTNTWFGGGSNTTDVHKVNYPSSAGWSVQVGSDQTFNGLTLDANDNLISASFGWTAAAIATLNVYDTAGNNLHTYSITDTAYGGSLIFQSVTAMSLDSNYMFGVNVSPSAGPNTVVYLAKMDTATNVIWDKYLDWGMDVDITAITKTADNGIVLLLSTANGMALHKMNSNGDSLWTQFHNRPTTGLGYRFKECSDRGFIIVGQFDDSISHAYLLKTDSLGRFLPDPTLDISGSVEFCQGDSTIISAQPGYTYLWSTGDTTESIHVYAAGDYFVTISDMFGGEINSDTINILVNIPTQPTITLNGDTLMSSSADLYQWYMNGLPIVGETAPTYIAVANGMYSVETWDVFGCSAMSEADTLTSVGISDVSDLSNTLRLSPNPANNRVVISTTFAGSISVKLISQIGQCVYSKKLISGNDIDVSQLAKGIYLCEMKLDDILVKRKLVVY